MHHVCADLAGRYETTVVWSGSAPRLPLIETNPLRRGGPLCPTVCIGMVLPFVDVYAVLAGWMHRVCADLAGCYENPVLLLASAPLVCRVMRLCGATIRDGHDWVVW
jgi:hypothetical protein